MFINSPEAIALRHDRIARRVTLGCRAAALAWLVTVAALAARGTPQEAQRLWIAAMSLCAFGVAWQAGRLFELCVGRPSGFAGLVTLLVACSPLTVETIRGGGDAPLVGLCVGAVVLGLIRRRDPIVRWLMASGGLLAAVILISRPPTGGSLITPGWTLNVAGVVVGLLVLLVLFRRPLKYWDDPVNVSAGVGALVFTLLTLGPSDVLIAAPLWGWLLWEAWRRWRGFFMVLPLLLPHWLAPPEPLDVSMRLASVLLLAYAVGRLWLGSMSPSRWRERLLD